MSRRYTSATACSRPIGTRPPRSGDLCFPRMPTTKQRTRTRALDEGTHAAQGSALIDATRCLCCDERNATSPRIEMRARFGQGAACSLWRAIVSPRAAPAAPARTRAAPAACRRRRGVARSVRRRAPR
jgi:hypothetical protein